MPRSIDLKPVSNAELAKTAGKITRFSTKYPDKAVSPQELRKAFKSWQGRQSKPTVPAVKEKKIKAVRFTASDIGKLRRISESPSPTAEAIVGQEMGPDQILGTLFSTLTALEFTKMESEFKRRMASAASPAARERVQSEWAQVVKAAQQAYASGGLKGMKEVDLRDLSQELRKNKANFNAVVKIANSGVVVDATTRRSLEAITVATGGWLPQTGVLIDPGTIITTIPGLCDKPFVEGVFTKHFSRSFSLTVSLYVPCPTWTNPFRWCHKNFTIASASFSLDLQVGYRVTCCGATAWGQASAQACGSIIGITFCAGCTAKIVGVAGIGRSGTGNSCTYGIGVNAQLKCTFAGITVFSLQVPFGFTVSGPCPPVGFCGGVITEAKKLAA
jgi:hypothetical protein